MTQIKLNAEFSISLHYELFFALQALTDPNSRIHPVWRRGALAQLTAGFTKRFSTLGSSPFLWPCVADAIEDEPSSREFEGIIHQIQQVPIFEFQRRILFGVLHDPFVVDRLLGGGETVSSAIHALRKTKQEWLAFIGLYPYEKTLPLAKALETLVRMPEEFRKSIISLLKAFWDSIFEKTWLQLQLQLRRSMEEKERLYQSCSFEEFARLALLRVEVNERLGALKAVRGGFRLPLKQISAMYFYPSCFNDQRHWTCYGSSQQQIVCFPYFDPTISLDLFQPASRLSLLDPEPDPALIFTALGDTTRYAIVSMLARSAASAADLARNFSLTPATVSHHIHVLREAGLLQEVREGNTICLSVNRNLLERLSELTVEKLFQASGEIEIKKTRRK
ncbi:MAG: hypothetical protein C5B54_09870 [Acidobacteria bacterium]|nr:MAG: hypothetical protein C5B54_09870 [Acidobacteriota bacterium]